MPSRVNGSRFGFVICKTISNCGEILAEFLGVNEVTDTEGSSKSDGVLTQALRNKIVMACIKKYRVE